MRHRKDSETSDLFSSLTCLIDESAHNHRMNPTGPIGLRCIGAFACVAGLGVELVLHGPARRVMRVPLGGCGAKER